MNNDERNPQEEQQQLNREILNSINKKRKKSFMKKIYNVGKKISNLVSRLFLTLFKTIILPILPLLIGFIIIIFLVFFSWDLIFNSRGKTMDYQEEDVTQYNQVALDDKGDITSTDFSTGNKIVQAFYTFFAEKSIWVVVKEDGINEPVQFNSEEYVKKYGENGMRDKYQREKKFYLNPNALWSLDEFLNKNQFRFPEQFVQPVQHDKDTLELKQLTDKDRKLTAKSKEYDLNTKKPKANGKKTEGVWDYGFGSILNYKKFKEESKKEGLFSEIEIWDTENETKVKVPIDEAEDMVKSDRYTSFNSSYKNKLYSKKMPERDETVYMIDQVTSPLGLIKNNIVQEWVDTNETFTASESFTKTVTVGGKPKKIEFNAYVTGNIQKFEARYEGEPDASQLVGGQYFEDYIGNYTTYVPKEVLTSFNFKDRTGKTDKELLKLLDRGAFGEGSAEGGTSSGTVDLGSFKLGSGASSDNYKKAMQYYDIFKKYGEMYGVDPKLLIAIACQESGGSHESYLGASRCASAGCGIMQIEQPGKTITKATAFNHNTGQMETMSINMGTVTSIDGNIKAGAMLQAERMKAQNYNIILALQTYNYGTGVANIMLKTYAQATGKTPEEVRNNPTDLGWLAYRADISDNPGKYINGWSHSRYGDKQYVEHVLRYYVADGGSGIWVKKEDGSTVTISPDGTFEIGSGSGGSSGSSSNSKDGWLKGIWEKLKEGWNKLFPEFEKPLSERRLEFSNKYPENQIQNVIKMMFVMEERKYITEYEDFTDEQWKKKYILLFTNPLGDSWGSGNGSNQNIDVASIFPKGFEAPIDVSPVTIGKPFDQVHQGIDLVAIKGTEVKAISDGKIIEVNSNSIKIQHDGTTQTYYSNLQEILVKQGDFVSKGQVIGKTGGGKEGNVLHLELSVNGAKQDPSWIVTGDFIAGDYNINASDAEIIKKVIDLGRTKIGCPYVWGAKGPNSFDCSGYTKWLYKQVTGVSIGDGTIGQVSTMKNFKVDINNIQPGDLLYRIGGSGNHVVMYIGNGKCMEAMGTKWGVVYSDFSKCKSRGLNKVYRPIAYINSKKGIKN
ncbi:peptidoglycan DD-metalloendopeptidase family protein [Clostridioides difficile]|uniref:peptidoglycan DD-metalloendopeptidase family protein n=1 Tax=Clostridioides difficile TaxID=1496 RepID=UPI0014321510|nr:peptidoglycan DD-metalloendopeptidase family protein [Clostridioides difficile]MCM0739836.1 peptidoglycan DD-metalloendopeptidase family protein [Clostridioides difficile]NJA72323.1 peptidoglycan DD-metalloendopeptidase family protein [Clostridioides difficile]HBF2930773.1 peptidoglycan DD-metalloendopeptidase family protein [Clostridioides difficile]HBF2935758.1 peptidoglycan DD-metalloendopeptidase family protein [Clostridioides difficile]HBZ0282953.1 peptidoglycan DD-metalloendopeptidase